MAALSLAGAAVGRRKQRLFGDQARRPSGQADLRSVDRPATPAAWQDGPASGTGAPAPHARAFGLAQACGRQVRRTLDQRHEVGLGVGGAGAFNSVKKVVTS